MSFFQIHASRKTSAANNLSAVLIKAHTFDLYFAGNGYIIHICNAA